METEYEAKFLDVDKDEVRARLKAAGALLKRAEFAQRRWVFDLPEHDKHNFARVRDEGGIFTMTVKKYTGADIDNALESEVVVDSFDNALDILTEVGCIPSSYQENRRELWSFKDAEITIDSWPFLNPFVEIEAESESAVKEAAEAVGFDWSRALFNGVNRVYRMKYGEHVNIREMPKLTFDMPNPFT